jgi:hypothetical protein
MAVLAKPTEIYSTERPSDPTPFYPKDGDSMYLRNIGNTAHIHTMQKPKSRINWSKEHHKIYVRIAAPGWQGCKGVSKSRLRSYYPQFLLAFRRMFSVIMMLMMFGNFV